MMGSNDDGAGKVLRLDPFESGCQKGELTVVERFVCSAFAGDDTGVFEDVAVEAKDANEGSFQSEVGTGLDHCSTQESTCVCRLSGRCGTEVAQKGVECRLRIVGIDDTVVVSRDGDDGCGVVTVGLIELVVVVGGFTEVVDEITQMK